MPYIVVVFTKYGEIQHEYPDYDSADTYAREMYDSATDEITCLIYSLVKSYN